MRNETRFTETEALLKALADQEADSGNTDLTDEYLRENFLPGELRRLEIACNFLAYRASVIRHQLQSSTVDRETS